MNTKSLIAIPVFLLLALNSFTALGETNPSPEETLRTYIDGLREGKVDEIRKSYYSEDKKFKFSLLGPIRIEQYQIVKKRIYTEKMAKNYAAVPRAKVGDVELEVKEIINGKEEMFTYLLRLINREWRIISHYAWGQPD